MYLIVLQTCRRFRKHHLVFTISCIALAIIILDEGNFVDTRNLMTFQSSATANLKLTSKNTIVKKSRNYESMNLIEREVCVLKRLQEFPWCPRLIGWSNDTMELSLVGVPVTKRNLPEDYSAQFRQILDDMESVGVKHNDIIFPCTVERHHVKNEVLVNDGRLSLVDFSWATIDGGIPCNVTSQKFVKGWKPCDDHIVMKVMDHMANKTAVA